METLGETAGLAGRRVMRIVLVRPSVGVRLVVGTVVVPWLFMVCWYVVVVVMALMVVIVEGSGHRWRW